MAKVPTCDDDLNVEYLNTILTGFKQITEVSIKIPSTHGTVSNVRKVSLEYDENTNGLNPATIVIKYGMEVAGQQFANGLDMMRSGNLYRHEVLAYKQLPDFTNLLPKVYFTECNEQQDFIIAMEDCAPSENLLQDGKENNLQKQMSHSEVMKTVTEIARFHSMFYHRPNADTFDGDRNVLRGNGSDLLQAKGLGWIPDKFAITYHLGMCVMPVEPMNNLAGYSKESLQTFIDVFDDLWQRVFPILLSMDYDGHGYGQYNIPEKLQRIKDDERSFKERVLESFSHLFESAPQTILHNDFRWDNIVFNSKTNNFKVVDWQLISVGCGILDIAYLLHNSINVNNMDWEDEILNVYVETLKKNGVDWLENDQWKRFLIDAIWLQMSMTFLFAGLSKSWADSSKINGVAYAAMYKLIIHRVVFSVTHLFKHHYS